MTDTVYKHPSNEEQLEKAVFELMQVYEALSTIYEQANDLAQSDKVLQAAETTLRCSVEISESSGGVILFPINKALKSMARINSTEKVDSQAIAEFNEYKDKSHYRDKIETGILASDGTEIISSLYLPFPMGEGETGLIYLFSCTDKLYSSVDVKLVEILCSQGAHTAQCFLHLDELKLEIDERKKTEKELLVARDKALEASRIKSEFLANISHEIRTPINCVIGMTALTLESELDAEQNDNLSMVKDSADSLLHIIDDILDFSKSESGELEFISKEWNLKNCIDKTIDAFKSHVEKKGIYLRSTIESDIPYLLLGDPRRLKQVIYNLLSNAVKFTETGGVDLSAKKEWINDTEVCIHFTISDTGIGIPPEKLRLIFDAFTQADGSTTRDFGGVGLGLTIASNIVSRFKGKIWIESEEGKGSVINFTSCFGLSNKLATELTEHKETVNKTRIITKPIHKIKNSVVDTKEAITTDPVREDAQKVFSLLLVEDNIINQKLAAKILIKQGYKVSIANNGIEAIEAFQNDSFDLILMDLQMPKMGGLEATEKIRELEQGKDNLTPIVAVTAHAMDIHKEQCIAAGMNGFITKPIKKDILYETIEKLLEPKVKEAT